MLLILIAIALLGHLALCVFLVNRLHGMGIRRSIQKLLDALWYILLLVMPLWVWLDLPHTSFSSGMDAKSGWAAVEDLPQFPRIYLRFCLTMAAVALIHRVIYLIGPRRGFLAATQGTRHVFVDQILGQNPARRTMARLATRLPLNEVLSLSITDKVLAIPRLETGLDGLTITHLSDLHLTGQWTLDFYRVVVAEANELQSDLIAITGDIVEKRFCLPWIPELLGTLAAELGVFFVLGNHELRIHDGNLVRQTLQDAGLTHVGGQCRVMSARGCPLGIAGNELPWYPPAPSWSNLSGTLSNARPLRIVLSHSPDQFAWAQRNEVDLLLAGHTHGGQVRFPGFGPLLSPSAHGIWYASGVFARGGTMMHVSRGISGTRPLRYQCSPEITRLTLVRDPRPA